MATFSIPIVLMIDAESAEEAQQLVDEWGEEVEMEDMLPTGTVDLDYSPNCDHNDDGQRLLILPSFDDQTHLMDPAVDDDDESDDFNDADEDFS